MADEYRIEVRNRRRKPGEPLRNLYSDILRLIALAFPSLDPYHRETIACDYFIDALADPDFALKVQEHIPANLADALRIAMQPENIEAIRTWPRCRNVTEVRAFMGTDGYYRRFIKDFSVIASPLYELLKKDVPFEWTDER